MAVARDAAIGAMTAATHAWPAGAAALGMIDLHSPVVLAVLIGWVLSVGMHEFGHGIAAYWAGDYTIRERGGLTLNPLQYLDPLTSIILPLIFLLMGGLPLPGGATFIRRDLIKSRAANCAVSLAGPAVNLLLFAICAALLQPKWGPMRPPEDMHDWSSGQLFAGTMAYLQFLVCILNLLPIPPLDGFQAISFFLPSDLRMRLLNPRYQLFTLLVLFMVLSNSPKFWNTTEGWFLTLLGHMGFDGWQSDQFFEAFRHVLFSQAA
jgi:Zn-dependent protease